MFCYFRKCGEFSSIKLQEFSQLYNAWWVSSNSWLMGGAPIGTCLHFLMSLLAELSILSTTYHSVLGHCKALEIGHTGIQNLRIFSKFFSAITFSIVKVCTKWLLRCTFHGHAASKRWHWQIGSYPWNFPYGIVYVKVKIPSNLSESEDNLLHRIWCIEDTV